MLIGFAVGIVFGGLFAAWELHTPEPMLDLRFFENPRFSAASVTVTLVTFAVFGSTFLLTQYFQFVLGYSPLKSGLMAMPVAIGMMLAAPNAPRFVFRWGTKRVVVIGICVTATAMLLYGSNTVMSSFVAGAAVRLLLGLGVGLTMAPATESIMGSLPLGKAGVGSAVNDTTRQTGGAIGIAVMGSIFAAFYHHFTSAAGKLPGNTAAAVHDSVGSALVAAAKLPAAQARGRRARGTRRVHRRDAVHVPDRRRHRAHRRSRGVEVAPRARRPTTSTSRRPPTTRPRRRRVRSSTTSTPPTRSLLPSPPDLHPRPA